MLAVESHALCGSRVWRSVLLALRLLICILFCASPSFVPLCAADPAGKVHHASERKVVVVMSPTRFSDASFAADAILYPTRAQDGTRQMCLLPADDVAVEDRLLQFHEDAKERHGTVVPEDLLLLLRAELENTCLSVNAGWWSYEICFGKQVRQFHAPDAKDSEIVLGYYVPPRRTTSLYQRDSAPGGGGAPPPPVLFGHDHRGAYVSYIYPHGAYCDSTPDPRIVEVRLYCGSGKDGGADFSMIEVGTCKYLALVYLPEACAFPELEEPSVDRRVVCYPL